MTYLHSFLGNSDPPGGAAHLQVSRARHDTKRPDHRTHEGARGPWGQGLVESTRGVQTFISCSLSRNLTHRFLERGLTSALSVYDGDSSNFKLMCSIWVHTTG